MPAATTTQTVLQLGAEQLTVKHPDKLLWPDSGITKLDYVQKLAFMAPYMLPHCEGRFLTTIRYPEGAAGSVSFYQKNCPPNAPPFVRIAEQGDIRYVVLDSLPTLLWLGSLYSLEFHVSCERTTDEPPDRWILDIDPTLEVEPRLMEATAEVGALLQSLGLDAVPKTSGATGVQVVMPIERGPTFDDLRSFGKFFSEYLAAKRPDLFTVERFKKNRGTLIYLDYLQFYPGRTLAAPYTPRARPGAPVSTPLTWEEVRADVKPSDYHLLNIEARLRAKGDLIGRLAPQPLGRVLASIAEL